MDKKKIAIVGLGKIGLFHLSVLRNLPGVEIVGLVDKVSSAQKMVKGMGIEIPFFPDVGVLLANRKTDGIFACVPPAFNLPLAQELIPRGCSLFLEKPMAANFPDAKKIVQLLDQQTQPSANAVGYMVAYYPTFVQAKKLISENAAGEIRRYSATLSLGEVFRKEGGWRQNPQISGGGAVAILGSHLLYLIQSFFGMPRTVRANLVKLFSAVEDIAQAHFQHDNNLFGDYCVSWSRPGFSEMGFQITVEGTQGYLDITENSVSLHAFEGHPSYPPGWKVWYAWDLKGAGRIAGNQKVAVDLGQQGYADQDNDFVNSIGNDQQPRVNWSEGLKVQKLIESIYRAGKSPEKTFDLSELE